MTDSTAIAIAAVMLFAFWIGMAVGRSDDHRRIRRLRRRRDLDVGPALRGRRK